MRTRINSAGAAASCNNRSPSKNHLLWYWLLGRPASESGRIRSRGSRPGTDNRRWMALMSIILIILVLRWRRTTHPGAPRVTGRTLHGGRPRRERSR